MKKILVVTDSLPNLYHGGGSVTCYAVVASLIRSKYLVEILSLSNKALNNSIKTLEEDVEDLLKLGVSKVNFLDQKEFSEKGIIQKLFPTIKNFFSGSLMHLEVIEIVEKGNFDAIFAYHWNAIASIFEIDHIPKLGLVGDPIHLPYLFRKEYRKRNSGSKFGLFTIKEFLLEKTQIPAKKLIMSKLLKSCTISGAFAAHHALELSSLGNLDCNYYRTPVPDPFGDYNRDVLLDKKFKILLIGHLQGIATMTGIEFFTNDILPYLNELIGPENFEIHVVGGYFETLPIHQKRSLLQKNILIRGHVSPSDIEFMSSHVLLVPTPIDLGIRVRIISGFSSGVCVVAHSANKKGIPELVNMKNSILGNNGYEMAYGCYTLYNDNDLRKRIEKESRLTYNTYFALNKAGQVICNDINKVISLD
jgi:hypothetical protein